MIEIADSIPIPPVSNATVYPFATLEIGQSFAVPLDKRASVQAIMTRHSKGGKRFTSRTVENELRVWRTK